MKLINGEDGITGRATFKVGFSKNQNCFFIELEDADGREIYITGDVLGIGGGTYDLTERTEALAELTKEGA